MTTAPAEWEWRGRTLVLALKIAPRGARDEWLGVRAQRIGLRLQAPAVEGQANRALVEFLAREFKVPKQRIRILAGIHSRLKRVAVETPVRWPGFIGPPDRD